MTSITIPQKLSKKGDLVVILRKDYEEFLELRKIIKYVNPTAQEKKAIARGKKEIAKGQYSSLASVKHAMEHRSR